MFQHFFHWIILFLSSIFLNTVSSVYFSCWLSLQNGAIWAFVAPALFVIVVRNLQKFPVVVFYTGHNLSPNLQKVCILFKHGVVSGKHWHSDIRDQDHIPNQRRELQGSWRRQCSQVRGFLFIVFFYIIRLILVLLSNADI